MSTLHGLYVVQHTGPMAAPGWEPNCLTQLPAPGRRRVLASSEAHICSVEIFFVSKVFHEAESMFI